MYVCSSQFSVYIVLRQSTLVCKTYFGTRKSVKVYFTASFFFNVQIYLFIKIYKLGSRYNLTNTLSKFTKLSFQNKLGVASNFARRIWVYMNEKS